MDVAVAIGADPATMYSAILPLPPDLDEMMIAGFLRGKPVEMVKCETVGSGSAGATPRSCWKATWSSASCAPRARSAITPASIRWPTTTRCSTSPASRSASDPIYATTIVGPPPMEDFYMGKAIERIFLPLMRLQLPEVRDICMPAEGIFHNLILVSIRKSYPLHARKVMHAIWGLGQAMFSKCIVVVDEDVDVQNVREVAWKALNNIDPRARYPVRDGPGGFARSRQPPAELRLEDGHRRHAQVAGGRVHAALAGRDPDAATR